jgi:hypothetical protein
MAAAGVAVTLPPCANVSATTDANGTFVLSIPSPTIGHYRFAWTGHMTALYPVINFGTGTCGVPQFDGAIPLRTPSEVTMLCGSASPTTSYVLATFDASTLPGSGVCGDSSGVVVSVAEVPGAKITYVDANGSAAPALTSTSTKGLACVTGLPTSGVVTIRASKAGCSAGTKFAGPAPLEAGALTLVPMYVRI